MDFWGYFCLHYVQTESMLRAEKERYDLEQKNKLWMLGLQFAP